MNNIDRLYERKKFFKIIFPELAEGEFYRIFQCKDEFSKVSFFNDVDEMNKYCENNRFNANTYISLSSTNGLGGSEEDLCCRNVICFDFDSKDGNKLEAKDIMYKFKELNLWYHILTASGNGYHAYMCIEPTYDMEKVVEVTKEIGRQLGADGKAMLSTQILRTPYSFNLKDENNKKQVNIVKMFEKDTIKRYDLEKLWNRFCSTGKYKSSQNGGNKATTHIINNNRMKPCVKEILERKVGEHNKNSDLQKIVVTLRRLNKTLNEIKYICKEWVNFDEGVYNKHVDYQVEYMYENLQTCTYDCQGCKYSEECNNKVESNFEYKDDEETISMEYKITKQLKHSSRTYMMSGNELLILSVLKHAEKELSVNEILEKITYKEKCALSERTLRTVVKILEEQKYITKIKGLKNKGIADKYRFNKIKAKTDNIFTVSYFPTLICIYGVISVSELRLYTYMRYKHDMNIKENKSSGNIFRINQQELADDLGVTQKNISEMVNGLIEAKILEIWEIKKNEQGFNYYTYRLVK